MMYTGEHPTRAQSCDPIDSNPIPKTILYKNLWIPLKVEKTC